MSRFDVIVIGAGAAGMSCAARTAQAGLRVALIDHWPKLGEKIRISGGGRCNFTNLHADRIDRYHGEDREFVRPALQACPPQHFIDRVRARGIAFHEKHRGQLFCDGPSTQIVQMLRDDCDAAGVHWLRPVQVVDVRLSRHPLSSEPAGETTTSQADATARSADVGEDSRFAVTTRQAGTLHCQAVVIATGGLALAEIGATDFGLQVASAFGLRVVPPRPGLVPLHFEPAGLAGSGTLAGVSLPVAISLPAEPAATAFQEDLLFTHRGLSGPAILQISTAWRPGGELAIALASQDEVSQALEQARRGGRQLGTTLATLMPRRLAAAWLEHSPYAAWAQRKVAELAAAQLQGIAAAVSDWRVKPSGSAGYRKAEVMAGGVATGELDPATMESRRVPGLYFVGEVVDVTGWLGGYNFQWAWASAELASRALAARGHRPAARPSRARR